jgi:capsular polysaccharide biosynthesis protein
VKDPDPMVALSADSADELRERLWAYEDFSATQEHPGFDVTGAFASLGFLRAALRRRRRLWLALGVLGFVIGLGVYKAYPPAYSASTTLLLTNEQGSDPTTAMLTNQSLAQSEPVAEAVVRQLGLSQTPGSLLAAYTAVSATEEVLQITANAPSSTRAVDEAQAIASQFLIFRGNILRTQQQQQATALNQEVTTAEQNLSSLGAQITALGGTVPSDNPTTPTTAAPPTTKVGKLEAKYTAADNALSTLKQQVTGTIAQDQVNVASMIDGSQVLDPATAEKHSKLKAIGYDVVTGLFAGLVLGMAIVVLQALISDRLRRRDDIAFALGAPVKLSVGPVTSRRLLASPRARAASERATWQIARHLRRVAPARAANGSAIALAVVPVDNARTVATAVVAMARSCAEDGTRVLIADLASGAPVARRLGAADAGIRQVHLGSAQVAVFVPDPDDLAPNGPLRTGTSAASANQGELERAFRGADLLLTVAELDPASGGDHLGTWATDAVAVITAGRTHGQHAYAVGEMLRLSGVRVASSVVIGADADDLSLGLGTAEPELLAGQP